MGVELAIRTQGYPQLIKQLGIVPPQQGPFWGLSTVVAPTYIVGANAEVSTSGPRFNNDQIIAAWIATEETARPAGPNARPTPVATA